MIIVTFGACTLDGIVLREAKRESILFRLVTLGEGVFETGGRGLP